MYTVLIVEDDPMITELNRRYTERDGRFTVSQCFAQPRRICGERYLVFAFDERERPML